MTYEQAMNLTASDLFGMFWWIGLLAVGWLIGRFASWLSPK